MLLFPLMAYSLLYGLDSKISTDEVVAIVRYTQIS